MVIDDEDVCSGWSTRERERKGERGRERESKKEYRMLRYLVLKASVLKRS